MIEPTRAMVHLIYERINFVDHDDSGIAEGLAEVFKLLAEERCMEARGHVYHPLAKDRPARKPLPCRWCRATVGHHVGCHAWGEP